MPQTSASTETSTFAISPHVFIRRGFSEVRPKRLNISKLLVSIVHQQMNLMRRQPDELLIFTDYSPAEVDEVRKFLKHICPVRLMPFGDELFFESVQKPEEGTRIFAVVGTKDPQLSPRFISAARAISSIAPQALESVDLELRMHLSNARAGDDLVFEESIGKSQVLELEKHSLKLLKRLQKDQSLVGQKVHGGWGFGVMGISNGSAEMSPVVLRRATVELTPADINLEIAERILFYLQEWLKIMAFENLKSCRYALVTTPYHVLTGQLMNLMREATDPDLRFGLSDYVFGWHPVLTLMEQLASEDLPIVGIHVEKFPFIHFTLINKPGGR
jgi:hypothetical protein